MIHLQAVSPDGETITASGRTRASAEAALIRQIEQQTGSRFRRKHGRDRAEFEPGVLERFSELPGGNYQCVCFPAEDGRLICDCRCGCTDPAACACGHSSFSEPIMPASKQARRKFADDDAGDEGDGEDLRATLRDLIDSADLPTLRQIAEAITAQNFDESADTPPDTSNLADKGSLGMNAERRRPMRFSESQSQDFTAVRSYYERNAAELRQAGIDPARAIADARDLIANGASASQILPRGA